MADSTDPRKMCQRELEGYIDALVHPEKEGCRRISVRAPSKGRSLLVTNQDEAITELRDTDVSSASIEITLADGTTARWTVHAGDPRIGNVESVLGPPGTIRA